MLSSGYTGGASPLENGRNLWVLTATPYGIMAVFIVAVVAHEVAHHFQQVSQRLFAVDEVRAVISPRLTDSSALRMCIGVW